VKGDLNMILSSKSQLGKVNGPTYFHFDEN